MKHLILALLLISCPHVAVLSVAPPRLAAAQDPSTREKPAAETSEPFRELRVSPNQRFLEYQDGTPFFYLGDTAWEVFHLLNREEVDQYLRNRAEKGFTVIQAVVLAELGGLEAPNAYGHRPITGKDPTRPNEPYFEHVDYVVERAEALGLVIGMLPTWGSLWKSSGIFTPDRARIYGRFLGERYRSKPIIWILGGDHNPETDGERAILDAMAHGIKEGDKGRHLITFHPRGPGLSSDYFHKANWLDFNMFQSSHAARDHDNGLFAEHDYQLRPPKPTLDGEPRYEDIPVGFYNAGVNPDQRFDDYDVRQALIGLCYPVPAVTPTVITASGKCANRVESQSSGLRRPGARRSISPGPRR
jgi:hypothetical protein